MRFEISSGTVTACLIAVLTTIVTAYAVRETGSNFGLFGFCGYFFAAFAESYGNAVIVPAPVITRENAGLVAQET